MKKAQKYILSAFGGAALGALTVFLSQLIIRNLAGLFLWIGHLITLDEGTLSYGAQILAGMKSASISSPWITFLLTGAVMGVLSAWLPVRRGKKILFILLGALLLLPLILAALWLTSVNEICAGNLIQSILPMLPHLL